VAKKLTKDEEASIIEEVRSGFSYTLVARRYGVDEWKIAKLCGPLRMRPGRGKKPHFDRSEMQKYYDQGLSDSSIANLLGCSSRTVFQWRRKAARLPSNDDRRARETSQKVVLMRDAGMRVYDISRKIGISTARVYAILAKARDAASSNQAS